MKRIAAFFAVLQMVMLGSPALAQNAAESGYGTARTITTESWIEEWDPATGSWVRIADSAAAAIPASANMPTITVTLVNGEAVLETRAEARSASRYTMPAAPRRDTGILAQYGPFVVTGPTSAAMMGSTDSASPAQFDAMLRDFPRLAVLDMVEAPGTRNDIANLALGRRIRAAGIATHVPAGGSVRSGAVELFLAGADRTIADGAQFAVHSWLDNHGREAEDFAADHPAHRLYLDYYVEMGMSETRAREFYAMTNSVPHASARWLAASDMRAWLSPVPAPRIVALQRVQTPAVMLAWVEGEAAPQPAVLASPRGPALVYGDWDAVNLAVADVSRLDSPHAFP